MTGPFIKAWRYQSQRNGEAATVRRLWVEGALGTPASEGIWYQLGKLQAHRPRLLSQPQPLGVHLGSTCGHVCLDTGAGLPSDGLAPPESGLPRDASARRRARRPLQRLKRGEVAKTREKQD